MNPPTLRIAVTPTIEELKCRYALWVYEVHAGENLTRAAEMLGVCRTSAREYIDKGRAHRAKAEAAGAVPAIDFIEIRKPEEEESPDAPIPG